VVELLLVDEEVLLVLEDEVDLLHEEQDMLVLCELVEELVDEDDEDELYSAASDFRTSDASMATPTSFIKSRRLIFLFLIISPNNKRTGWRSLFGEFHPVRITYQ